MESRLALLLLFWALNAIVILRGISTIRFLQGITAPALLILGLRDALVGIHERRRPRAQCFPRRRNSKPSANFSHSSFRRSRVLSRFWATVALNIPDFTRYAKGQREQMLGQALGLPTTMTFYSFHRNRGHVRYRNRVRASDLGSGRCAQSSRAIRSLS